MTILPAKRQTSGKNEETEESDQPNQQLSLGLAIPPSRLNHSSIPLGLNISQGHGQLLMHQETTDRQLWNRHDDIQHGRGQLNHSPSSFDDTPSSSKRRNYCYSNISNVKERYFRNHERKRMREQKQNERVRERDIDQNLECDRNLEHQPTVAAVAGLESKSDESSSQQKDETSGYNSEDEYSVSSNQKLSDEEWRQRDLIFARSLEKRGFVIKPMVEDGACLFRAIADQVYGDQEMHSVVRTHCMDYILKNRDFYCAYVTEDFNKYVSRKRHDFVHGNHLEIQALSEMYHRSIEVYCYQLKPINIFHGVQKSDYEPIRLSYQRASHYNSITNPFNPSVGVGLGLPSYNIPGEVDRRQLNDAVRQSEELLIEQTMMEDKLKATDWEATNEVIEEQVARESYLQWCKDNEKRRKQLQSHSGNVACSSSTVTSGACVASPRSGGASPRSGGASPRSGRSSPRSPKPRCSNSPLSQHSIGSPRASSARTASPPANLIKSTVSSSEQQSSSQVLNMEPQVASSSSQTEDKNIDVGQNFCETDSIFSRLPPEIFGLCDWEDADVMARVLAASQQEYLDSLKAARNHQNCPGPSTSR